MDATPYCFVTKERGVADEAKNSDLLYRRSEGVDVGSLAARLVDARDRAIIRSASHEGVRPGRGSGQEWR